MNKTKQFRLLTTLFCLSILADVFVSCDSRRGNTSTEEAVAMIQAASQKRDYNRILTLADLVANNICGHLDSAVNQHRNGAEPNDDLTMMCVSQK